MRQMVSRLKPLLFVVIVIAVACVVRISSYRIEPSYKGRTLTTWLTRHADHGVSTILSDDDRAEAEAAVRRLGTNALPALLDMAKVRDSSLKAALLEKLPDQLRTRLGLRADYDYNDLARDGFQILGSAAKPAVPVLVTWLNDKDQSVRATALEMLGAIGPSAEDSIAAIVGLLRTGNSWCDGVALTSLGEIRSKPNLVVPLLVEKITNSSTSRIDRIYALMAVGEFHTEGRAAISVVQEYLSDPDPPTRHYATNALMEIDPGWLQDQVTGSASLIRR